MTRLIALLIFVALISSVTPQPKYDLLIRGGHVIDPRNGINEIRDVTVANGLIAAVGRNIPLRDGKPSIEIVPGSSPAKEEKQHVSVGVWQMQPGEAEIVARRLRESLKTEH